VLSDSVTPLVVNDASSSSNNTNNNTAAAQQPSSSSPPASSSTNPTPAAAVAAGGGSDAAAAGGGTISGLWGRMKTPRSALSTPRAHQQENSTQQQADKAAATVAALKEANGKVEEKESEIDRLREVRGCLELD